MSQAPAQVFHEIKSASGLAALFNDPSIDTSTRNALFDIILEMIKVPHLWFFLSDFLRSLSPSPRRSCFLKK
jgi:hypothetical protein